jgi:UPF0755 protein
MLSMKKLIAYGIIGVILATLICSISLFALINIKINTPINSLGFVKESVEFTVEKGARAKEVTGALFDRDIIPDSWAINVYAKLAGLTNIKAGRYKLNSVDTPLTLLKKFNSGEVIQYQITFVEGWSFSQWLSHFSAIDQFDKTDKRDLLNSLKLSGIDDVNLEGWFFPDTYYYLSSDTALDIMLSAHRKMKRVLAKEWAGRATELPYKTPYEALIMASIIEKETGLAEEREEIAGVFVRRLLKGMRLQTDPTVIYGMGDQYDGDLRRRDLRQPTPYNTYLIKGLPPTPIAMPSEASISAALHPKAGSSLYFVARGDGGHYFSNTLPEHRDAVNKYQLEQRAENYRSAPN